MSNMERPMLETIGVKLLSLEERLAAENESHGRYTFAASPPTGSGTTTAATTTTTGMVGLSGVGGGGTANQQQRPTLEKTPNRNRKMMLPFPSSPPPASETETDKKLKKIMKQTGILTINGTQYATDIKDLEHLGDLGNGTSGNVVKMRHVPSDTIIAVKQMRRTGNAEENKRILMDLDVVLKSDCKYIVQCLGCFVRDPDVWICMELMSMCFDKLLKMSKKPVPEHILGKVTVATVKALSYLKEKHNVIHRDVKPSNILIDARGNIKLCDFGISGRLVDSKANTRSAGCAAYMAPERIDPKKPEYDIRADVWSLGITLVELATARSPYDGCNTDFEVLTKVLDSEPPSLPCGEFYTFSQSFRDFVNKCLTKNYQYRPKYPELMEQPFIKFYEKANIDVPQWFTTFTENAGIKMHSRSYMPTAASKLYQKVSNSTVIATPVATTITPMTINAKLASNNSGNNTKTTKTATAANMQQSKQQQQYQQLQQQHQYYNNYQQYPQHQATQLPQPIANYYNTNARERGGGGSISGGGNGIGTLRNLRVDDAHRGGGGGGGSGSSSSATSTSPQSPPSIGGGYQPQQQQQHSLNRLVDDTAEELQEMQRLYRKSASPFMARKYYNGHGGGGGIGVGGNSNPFKYTASESPKKESMLSSIGQSIIRNLTTSPFSQKKHTLHALQANQIDPLWRMPTTQDCALAYDNFDGNSTTTANTTNKLRSLTNSPAVGRKRYQASSPAIELQQQQQQPEPSLIALNRSETNPQRVQGNQSPIVLQRFYHQQNLLREKELERHLQQQLASDLGNPFLNHYGAVVPLVTNTTPTTTAVIAPYNYALYEAQQQQSHIPISVAPGTAAAAAATTISSSQSTSSQSSTQSSTCSQIAAYDYSPQTPKRFSPPMPSTALQQQHQHQLQYQPLPQYTRRQPSASPPTTSTIAAAGIEEAGGGASRLGQVYVRQQLQATVGQQHIANAGNGSSATAAVKDDQQLKDEQGWFNSLAGAMKRQFASYVKLQLNSSANASGMSASGSGAGCGMGKEAGHKSLRGYYRAVSASSSSNTSSSTSPTEVPPVSAYGKASVNAPATSDYELANSSAVTNGSFLRRYAATGGMHSGHGGIAPGAHIYAGLDRRHRSPDPPPRYNRGQSPLLLRKNLLELGGQTPGSPLLNRRYVTASPPLPPPRRGSESVPGSPQHFRTRIHYTPEPQRRIYRTIDQ